MTAEQYIKAQLAAFCWREAGHAGGIDPLLAIALVLRNRQRAGWFGGDWMEIISQAHAAAPLAGPSTQPPNLRDFSFRQFLAQIDDVYNGTMADLLTQGAKYYAELAAVEAANRDPKSYAQDAEADRLKRWIETVARDPENHARVATVGGFSFFL